MTFLRPSAVFLATLLAATPALAHVDAAHQNAFLSGVTHPLYGLDHLLAMVVAGLWAAQIGGQAPLRVAVSFVIAMLVGFVLARLDLPLPLVEPMILATSIVLGVLVLLALRLSARQAAALAGLFALFHGHAHGAELGGAHALGFAAGFALATALLIGIGVGIGQGLRRDWLLRVLGGGAALIGVTLALG